MDPQSHLLLTTAGYAISFLIVSLFGLFVLLQKPRTLLNKLWFLCCMSVAAYQLAFIIGVNISHTTKLAYWIWYSNIIENIFTGMFALHFFTLAADGIPKFKKLIVSMYAIGGVLLILSVLFPEAFLIDVSPKLYLLSYINQTGPLYFIVVGYILMALMMSIYILIKERPLHGPEGKKRINYYLLALTVGTALTITGFSIELNLPIDPGVSAFLGIFTLPFLYGMVKKDLMNIRVVVRKVTVVTLFITFVSVLFISASFFNDWLIVNVPHFKSWVFPLISAITLVIVGFLYYKKEEESDDLKYEFITTMAHKFRTPLTRIRWQTNEIINKPDVPIETKEGAMQINESTLELIYLSNLLMSVGKEEKESYVYSYKYKNLAALVEKIIVPFKSQLEASNINFSVESETNLPDAYIDEEKLASAIYVFIENSIKYTKKSGSIKIKIYTEKDTIWFLIKDTGIGISDKDRAHIFNRFYRGESARLANTEGVGLGLFMAKTIIERQGGSVGVNRNKDEEGTTFWFTLPIRKQE